MNAITIPDHPDHGWRSRRCPPVSVALRAADDSDAEIKALREQIRLLDQRLHQLEQKQQLKEQEAAAAAKAAPKIAVTDKGFTLASGDGANSLRIGGLVQLDSRLFFGDGGGVYNNSFVLRRARLISEGTFGRIYSFQLVSEFGGTSAPSILDANLGIALEQGACSSSSANSRRPSASNCCSPTRRPSSPSAPSSRTSCRTATSACRSAAASRDGAFTYAAGIFNGVADGASTSNVGLRQRQGRRRAGVRPAVQAATRTRPGRASASALPPASAARKAPPPSRPATRPTGSRRSSSTTARWSPTGSVWRVSPQAYYSRGPFSALGEYVVSTVNARPSGDRREDRAAEPGLAAGRRLCAHRRGRLLHQRHAPAAVQLGRRHVGRVADRRALREPQARRQHLSALRLPSHQRRRGHVRRHRVEAIPTSSILANERPSPFAPGFAFVR